ncbi:MAG: hypothetical protein WC666_04700 [Candidatus Paceibacterota bacterium]|jgi:hypothetical protein
MKNSQKGFVAPLLIVIIALLFVGGGMYIYKNNKAKVPVIADNTGIQQSDQVLQKTIKPEINTYSDASVSFEYPSSLLVKPQGETVTLNHSIAYKHSDPCDFKGDAPPLERLSDFSVSIKVVNKNLKELVQSSSYPGWDYVSKNPFKSGSLNGYKIMSGVEGCGEYIYYLTISPTKTLVINRAIVTEFEPIIAEYQTNLNLPGIISPNQAEEYFTKILSSFKSI